MDKFKEYIEQERESFDSYELPAGHTRRMADKLPKESSSAIRRFLLPIVATAAVIAGVVISLREPAPSDQPVMVQSIAQSELIQYYSSQLEVLKDSLRTLSSTLNPEMKADMLTELELIENEKYRFNSKLLPQISVSEDCQTVVYTFYTSKIESLEYLLSIAHCKQLAHEYKHQ